MPQHKTGKGGTKKYGRNEAKCKAYRLVKAIPNKRRKLRRHLATHSTDGCAIKALGRVGRLLSAS